MKNKKYRYVFIFSLVIMFLFIYFRPIGSNTSFYPLNKLISKYIISDGVWGCREYIIISNPPEDLEELIHLIEKYNSKTLLPKDVSKYSSFDRWFFNESRSLPRNYKENPGGWDQDLIEDHEDDLIISAQWFDFGKTLKYYLPNSDELFRYIYEDCSKSLDTILNLYRPKISIQR